MVLAWPEPVERVSCYLREAGAEARIEEFDDATLTAVAAAAAVGCELAQIVKSLVLMCDGKAVIALVPGDRRGDLAKVARATGADVVRVASADQVERATGFAPGAVAPFALARVDSVILDRTLLRHPQVWVGGGSPNHLVGLAPTELGRLTRARPMDVVQDDPYHSAADFPDDSGGDPGGDPAEPKER